MVFHFSEYTSILYKNFMNSNSFINSNEESPLLQKSNINLDTTQIQSRFSKIYPFFFIFLFVPMIIALSFGFDSLSHHISSSFKQKASQIVESEKVETDSPNNTCACPDVVKLPDCSNNDRPVLGGLDVVDYFSFANESQIGTKGSSTYSRKYHNYKFYFRNSENLKTFKQNPDRYVPQYGGFCSWGVGGEYCPTYPWASDCLGPSGNWGIWTIYNDHLYFFYLESAKDNFMKDPEKYIAIGNSRWTSWFYQDNSEIFNTQCYFQSSSGFIERSAKPMVTLLHQGLNKSSTP